MTAQGPSTARVEAFSDAVIAVAATLLVLDLDRPAAGEDVWRALGAQVPSLAAYVVSFGTILIFWVNHHGLIAALATVSRAVLFVNGLLLLGVSFVSYSTAVLGDALRSGEGARSAAVLYALVLGATSLCFTGLWLCLRARPLLLTEDGRRQLGPAIRRSLAGPAVYAVAVCVALVSAPASLVLDALVAGYFAVRPVRVARTEPVS